MAVGSLAGHRATSSLAQTQRLETLGHRCRTGSPGPRVPEHEMMKFMIVVSLVDHALDMLMDDGVHFSFPNGCRPRVTSSAQ